MYIIEEIGRLLRHLIILTLLKILWIGSTMQIFRSLGPKFGLEVYTLNHDEVWHSLGCTYL